MNIDEKIEARLRVLEECIKEAIEILLDAYNEKSFISHLFYIKQDEDENKTITNS